MTTTGTVVKLFNDKVSAKARRATNTAVDTIVANAEKIGQWQIPPFQRPLRVNDKVRALAEEIKADGGVIPGVITLGKIASDTYLLDGQHRREAFLISGCTEAYMDIRIHTFTSMADMGEEFVRLNSQLVRMRPDDILRGLEATVEALGLIKKRCPFVGYDMIRRGPSAPVLSMSNVIRVWVSSGTEVPGSSIHGGVATAARDMQTDDANKLCDFLELAVSAWGRDPEYYRLWGSLNLTICAWLYRRICLTQYSAKTQRMSAGDFKKCLMALSADESYVDWLVGRQVSDVNRSPCLTRIKNIFAKRIEMDTGKKPFLPQPPWLSSNNTRAVRG